MLVVVGPCVVVMGLVFHLLFACGFLVGIRMGVGIGSHVSVWWLGCSLRV